MPGANNRGRTGPGGNAPANGPTLTSTPKQDEFLDAIFSGLYKYLAFGGGIRGTKTFTGLIAIIMLCKMFPGSRWAIVRKDLPTLRRNTIPSMNKIRWTVNNFVGDINQSIWTYPCSNGSEIIIFPESFEGDPDLDRWKGLEVNGFLLEEANELVYKSFSKAIERAGSWIIPNTDVQPPVLVLLTFNPANNWVREVFYDPWKAGSLKPPFFFLPATIMDNPYASDEYRESLKNLPPEDYRRFVEGEWEGTDDPDQLIKTEWIWHAKEVEPTLGTNKLGNDVARYGDDATVFALCSGNTLVWLQAFQNLSIDRTAMSALGFAQDVENEGKFYVHSSNIRIDGVGLGAGVIDLLRRGGHHPYEVISGAKPIVREEQRGRPNFYRYANLRSQMWWEAKEKFRLGLVSLPEDVPARLITDLVAPRYVIASDRTVLVESKEDIKERLGRSTDFGDALVMALFDIPEFAKKKQVPPTVSKVTV